MKCFRYFHSCKMRFFLLTISLISLICLSSMKKVENRIYLNDATFKCDEFNLSTSLIEDTIPEHKLVVRYAEDGSLHSFCRRIQTSVCMKSECKPIDITLHWTLTGRYLGFELDEREYLSKVGHEPFSDEDYKQLHEILSDPYSPLRDVNLNSVLENNYSDEVDGISSATNTDIEDYIVKDALFTSYTLWHIVYGTTSKKLMELTREKLEQKLIMKILQSTNKYDVVWGLKNMPDDVQWTDELTRKLIELTKSDNYLIAEQAVNHLNQELLSKDWGQLALFDDFASQSFLRKRNVIRQLTAAPFEQGQNQKFLSSRIL